MNDQSIKKKTKIVATIGPSSWDYKTLKDLTEAGMNVARLNFSHGTQEEKKEQIKHLRRISKELSKPIAILADLSGPKLRLGQIEGVLEIKKGQIIKLSANPKDLSELPLQFDLTPFVKKGQRIFLNDGLVELTITSANNDTITTEALNSGWISSKKGVNVPDTNLRAAAFTEKDKDDAIFALSQDVDYLALSFVQSLEHINMARDLIKKHHKTARIVVKFEKKEAIDIMEDIVVESDAIMVARGDLGIEIPAAEVPVIQKRLIKLCREHQKPVIVATQMLESMTENPRPTRAEVSDVANAVLDQVDSVMLSAESANGKYPIEAVTTMKDIILTVEQNELAKSVNEVDWESIRLEDLSFSAIASSAAYLATKIKARAIVVATATGRTARLLSSFRPAAGIVAITHDEKTSNQLALIWGVRSVVTKPYADYDKFIEKCIEGVLKYHFVNKGDKIVVIAGTHIGLSGNTDTIKVLTI